MSSFPGLGLSKHITSYNFHVGVGDLGAGPYALCDEQFTHQAISPAHRDLSKH